MNENVNNKTKCIEAAPLLVEDIAGKPGGL